VDLTKRAYNEDLARRRALGLRAIIEAQKPAHTAYSLRILRPLPESARAHVQA